MHFYDLYTIAERNLELINPTSPEKIVTLGKYLRLNENSRIIDYGCGYAEPLILWAENFGIQGVGIEVREPVCERAVKKLKDRGLDDRIEIVCAKGAEYKFEAHSFDVATCIGASFIWDGYESTVKALKKAVKKDGRIGIGEPYWASSNVPPEYAKQLSVILSEYDLLRIARAEGYDVEYIVRANLDEWDRYEAENYHGLVQWIEENPDHPEFEEVVAWLHKTQDDYFKYGREYLGWAMYALAPAHYRRT